MDGSLLRRSCGQAVLAEAVGTYLLVLTTFALAVDRRAPGGGPAS